MRGVTVRAEPAGIVRNRKGCIGIQIERQVIPYTAILETVKAYDVTRDVHALILGRA